MSFLSSIRRHCAALMFSLVLSGTQACAGDVILDHLSFQEDRGVTRIARLEVINSNLSADEVRVIFSGRHQTSLELLSRFIADRVFINGMTFSGQDGMVICAPITLIGIDQGHLARVNIEGIEADVRSMNGGENSQFKARALELEHVDFASLLQAALRGQIESMNLRAEKLIWEGFEWSGPDPKVPAYAPGGNRIRLALSRAIATTQYEGTIPVRSFAELTGLTLEVPPSTEGGRHLAELGYRKLEFSFTGQMNYDPRTRDMVMDHFTLSGVKAGRLTFSGRLGNVDPIVLTGVTPQEKMAALLLANISVLDLNFVNEGAVETGFALAAGREGREGRSGADLRSDATMFIGQMMPLMLGGNPAALPLTRAAQEFLRDPKNLALTLK